MHCDSQNAIYLAKHQVYHASTKHIDVRFHKIRELIVTREIVLEKIDTSENAADMLTKPIPTSKFKHCLDLISVCGSRGRRHIAEPRKFLVSYYLLSLL